LNDVFSTGRPTALDKVHYKRFHSDVFHGGNLSFGGCCIL
jgi:hypothetical protein